MPAGTAQPQGPPDIHIRQDDQGRLQMTGRSVLWGREAGRGRNDRHALQTGQQRGRPAGQANRFDLAVSVRCQAIPEGPLTGVLQQTPHTAAAGDPILKTLAGAGANGLLVALAAGLGLLAVHKRFHLSWGLAARVAASGVAALLVTQRLGHAVDDPRPFLAEHALPLATASLDYGFPGDHALVAALITGRAGQLTIGAHHSLAVLGSVPIAGVSLGAASVWPWRGRWRGWPLLPRPGG